ncbi:penicillin-binding protein 1A [Bacillus sp. B15-48]|uniref:transglycosylase domain-containing protein n=1 Tax=Bacillus sp. B15-48 TaxID=1548601 RepID=UPI00193EF246|nr:penicillin-binding protein 1A [Bacillus sp. B15-48]MBM4762088.1 PBP1A family penicillin-binding protein [Bacillus sp. B15-48]
MTDKPQTREERNRKRTDKKRTKKQRSSREIFKKVFLGLIIFGIISIIAGASTFAFMVRDVPELDEAMLKDPITSNIYDMNGEFITQLYTENRVYIEYDDIPKIVENAVIATEDVRFYEHNGLDPIRLVGAVIANITDGFGAQGASTITQQVVKNYFLSFDKTLDRKAQEAWLAFQLERKYTKEEIFEMYFNKIFMSESSRGIGTAAKVYFGKEIKDVELHEAALLAGIPQSPNNYNPFTNPERAEQRRNTVLSLMHQHGFISEEEMKAAQAIPVTPSLVLDEEREKRKEQPYDAFIDLVIDEVEKHGDFDIFSDGLEIYTTLDPDAQKYVETSLNTNEVINYPNDEVEAGIVLLDTQTGEVRAIGGGRNREGQRGWNYATDLKRQTGSTIKPVLDYGPAIEYLNWGTYHMLEDKPYQYSNGQPISNWNNRYEGPMTMRTALAKSRNIPALQALQQVGLDKARDFAVNLGLGDLLPDPITESAALGSYEMSPLNMAGAFAAFGNNGFYTEPHVVKKIVLRDKTEIDLSPETKVAMNDYTAFMITDMLKTAVTSGTGTEANIRNLPVAGKTGTTNYTDDERQKWNIPNGAVPDSWFVGYTTKYTAAIWTGYEYRDKALLSDGYQQKIPQILFRNIVSKVSEGIDTPDYKMPNSVVRVAIEKGSFPAKLASNFTPKEQILYEYAVKGNLPSETSTKFEKLKGPENLSAAFNEETNEITLSWKYSANEDVSFEVSASLNGGSEQQLKTTTDMGLVIANPEPGGTYSFKVVAISDGQRSDPASTTIQIPSLETEEEATPIEEDAENNNGNNNGNGNGNNNSDNGNGNGNREENRGGNNDPSTNDEGQDVEGNEDGSSPTINGNRSENSNDSGESES